MKFFVVLVSCLFLSGCVSQSQADVKMAKGCAAGVNALLQPEGKEILEVKSKDFTTEEAEGGKHRRVTLNTVEKDGWLELDKSYSCLFAQEWGLFKMFHRGLLVQIKVDDKVVGKEDGKIVGNFDDFTRLIKAVDGAMAQ